jgi:hypothetical protein
MAQTTSPSSASAVTWSSWFRCESSFSLLLVPNQAGVFAVAKEVIKPGENDAVSGKRMLAIFHAAESNDLARALNGLLRPGALPHSPDAGPRWFVRYSVIDDAAHRQAVAASLQHWLATAAEVAAAFTNQPSAAEAPAAADTGLPSPAADERRSEISPSVRDVTESAVLSAGS